LSQSFRLGSRQKSQGIDKTAKLLCVVTSQLRFFSPTLVPLYLELGADLLGFETAADIQLL